MLLKTDDFELLSGRVVHLAVDPNPGWRIADSRTHETLAGLLDDQETFVPIGPWIVEHCDPGTALDLWLTLHRYERIPNQDDFIPF